MKWMEGDMESWGADCNKASLLEEAAFAKEFILSVLQLATKVVSESSHSTQSKNLTELEQATKALGVVLAKVPDPSKQEKKFLQFMVKEKTKVNQLGKHVEMVIAKLKAATGELAKDHGTEMEKGDALAVEAQNMIVMNTLVLLVRSPAVHTDKEQKSWLEAVLTQFLAKDSKFKCYDEHIELAKKILGPSVVAAIERDSGEERATEDGQEAAAPRLRGKPTKAPAKGQKKKPTAE